MTDPNQFIQLSSPVANNFETWIVGNACFYESVKNERVPMVEENSKKGKTLVIAGAGPSLRDNLDRIQEADDVWACNSALPYLYDNGHKVTHAVTCDQTPEMLSEWASTPPVEYILATSVHPHLTELLVTRGRKIRMYHNYVGIKKPPVSWADENGVMRAMAYEDWLYALLYDGCLRAGSGLNSVTRAIDVASYMGYDKITVLGADCALRVKKPQPKAAFGSKKHRRWLENDVEMHADGGNAVASRATAVTMNGEIDGRLWTTKPDMMISAVFLVRMAKRMPQLEIVGDTLPSALMGKDDDFLDRLPSLVGIDGKPIRFN